MEIDELEDKQSVRIDLSGLEADSITLGSGLYGVGEVTEIRAHNDEVVVHLDEPIAGKSEIVVSADRLTASS